MAWWDGFAAVDQALGGQSSFSGGYKPYKAPRASFGTRPRVSSTNWSDLASGRMATSKPAAAPVGPPERFDIKYPFSSTGPQSPYAPPPVGKPASTEGDLMASFAAAGGQAIGQLNLGNFIPWFMERTNTLAHDLAASDIPVVKEAAGVMSVGTQAFIDGVQAVSQPVGQAFDAFPSWVRDSQLKDRAKLYRAMANGEVPDFGLGGPVSNPLATIAQFGSLIANPVGAGIAASQGMSLNPLAGLTGQTVSDQAQQAKHWQEELLQAVDPHKRLAAETRLAILRDSIDLPESVKLQLERSPRASDDEVGKWLDEAPEGKTWSYSEGPAGFVQNMGTPLLFFIAEAKGGYGALGAARASALPGVATGAQALTKGISVTARLQTAAVATGVGLTAVNTTMGAIARYQGADEAIEWFDNANRTTDFSDDPMVQLATGFAVNPFAAAKLAGKGGKRAVVSLKHGLVDVPLDKLTNDRLLRFYDSTDALHDMTRRMYKLGSNEEAATFLDEQGLRGQAHDMTVGTALDMVLDRLPKEERIAWNAMHADPVERAGATLARWGRQAVDLIEKSPDLVAAKFHEDWQRRMANLPFHSEYAAKVALDYRRGVDRTYDLRQGQRLVVGYRESLSPKGQALARSMLDKATGEDGMVTVGDLTAIVVDLPVLRRHLGGVPMVGPLPRAAVERMIDSAAAEWAHMAKVDPVRARTGVSPVLRPDSPTVNRDYAEALGTNIDTIKAVSDANPAKLTNTEADLLRKFLVDRGVVDEATVATLKPQDVWAKARDHIEEVTAPWVAMGERVAGAETQMTRLRGELARVAREKGATQSDRTVRIQREINELADLVRLAGDPIRTAASRASGAEAPRGLGDSHLADLAARKVDALERLRSLQSVTDELDALGLTEADLGRVVRGADGELGDIFDTLAAPPTPVLDAYLAYRTAAMQVTRSVKGELTRRRQQERGLTVKGQELVRYTEEAPGSYQWAEIAKSPGFVKRLRQIGDEPAFHSEMTGNQMADVIEAAGVAKGASGVSLDDIATRMTETRGATAEGKLASALGGKDKVKAGREGEARAANLAVSDARGGSRESGGAIKENAPGPVTREQALQRLADLRKARETALDGKGVAAAKRTAGIKVPDDYVAQAEADRAAQSLVYDAEYDAFWHPRNVAKVLEITARADELYPGLRSVVEGDAELMEGILRVASRTGQSVDEVLSNPEHAAAVKAELVPADFEAPVEGLIREWTNLDHLITAGEGEQIAALAQQLSEARVQPREPIRVSQRVAEQLAKMPTRARSYTYRREMSDAGGDFKATPSERILSDPANKIGVETLSVLNHGIAGTRPATIDGVVSLLRDIENGAAGRMGIGPELQAEAQRVARALLDDAVTGAKKDPNIAGTFTKGFFPEDEADLARTIDDLLSFDQSDPLGTLQYGLKKAPNDAVVMEWSKVPGLAEELMSERFAPYVERAGVAEVRKAFNWVFGGRSNALIRAEAKNRFVERLGKQGITPTTATGIWEGWARMAHDSRLPTAIRNVRGKKTYVQGDSPRFSDIGNIPNHALDAEVKGIHGRTEPGIIDRLDMDPRTALSPDERALIEGIDFAREFRESTSFIRRTLADSKVPLGRAMADAYGLAVHNRVATTYYYWFRFAMDTRYWAMNYMEAQILGLGRAGLRKGEIDEGLLGQSEGFLRNLDSNPMDNTGMNFTRDRHANAYRVFTKEQPDALRAGLRDMDPAVADRAIREMAQGDPQLADMIRELDGFAPGQKIDPTKYLGELDAWHKKMLANVDETTDAATIDEALAKEMAATPHLAEMFDLLGQVNKDLWSDIRETFYGNPNRSRAERFLNSYLLFWPLSYQVKSTKWFAKVLFDRVGGLQTNALGAVSIDRMADTHNRLLATDPEYKDWFEKHDTLVFVAQMFFPVSLESTGVSLSPPLRSLFFDKARGMFEIGPIYTYNKVIRPVLEELYVDLYPTMGDLIGGPYRALTGKNEPDIKK